MKTIIFAMTLVACHGGHHKNPDKQVDWVAGHIEKKLDLRAEQLPQYHVLVDEVKVHLKQRIESGKGALTTVKAEFDKPQADADKLVALAKQKVRERPTPEQYDAFIDHVGAFYKTLDQKQQTEFAELVQGKLDWID